MMNLIDEWRLLKLHHNIEVVDMVYSMDCSSIDEILDYFSLDLLILTLFFFVAFIRKVH